MLFLYVLISNNNIYYKTSSCVIDGITLPNINESKFKPRKQTHGELKTKIDVWQIILLVRLRFQQCRTSD